MKDIYKKFLENFDEVIKKYNLDTEEIDDSSVGININGNQLKISCSIDGALIYFLLNEGEKATLYDVNTFISLQISNNELEGIIKAKTIYEKISNDMKLTARCLDRHFPKLLQGDMKWFEEYKKSEDYDRLRIYNNVTKEVDPSLYIDSFRELNEDEKKILREKILKLIVEYSKGKFDMRTGKYMKKYTSDKEYYYIEKNGSNYQVVNVTKKK